MIQKQKIEAQYLKLIGVTLLMTAACVSDSGNKKSLFFADDHVREIILEQFQFLSTAQYHEVLDWENAINEAGGLPQQEHELEDVHSYTVVTSNQSLPAFEAPATVGKGLPVKVFDDGLKILLGPDQITFFTERNKHSLVTRAGPLA
jgi:hypothetical protein